MPSRRKTDSKKPQSLRERAEAALRQQHKALTPVAREDAPRLLHELEVHQIELQAQNEELRRALAELEESRDHFSNLYDFAPAGYFTLDQNAVIVEPNLRMASLLGVGRASLAGKGFTGFLAPESQDVFYHFWRGLGEGRNSQGCELSLRNAAGNQVAVSLMTMAPVHSGGEHSWRCVIVDITERKRAESELRASEQRLQSYLDHAADAIYVLDAASGRVLNANRRAAQMLGYSMDELLKLSAMDIETTHSPEEMLSQPWGLPGGRMQVDGVHRRKDASTVPVEIRMTSLAPSQPDAVLAIVSDISERKRAEQEREQETRRKDEFMALLGHELRNPLTAFSTAMELLQREGPPEERASLHEIAGRQIALMRRVLDDLLDLGRIAHGHFELTKESIDLAGFLQKVAAAIQPAVAERAQRLVLRLPSGNVAFVADRARLEQVAGNLLSNASKYTRQGGTIEFSGAREDNAIVLRCRDSGRGIPPEIQKKIFEPFMRGAATVDDYGQASLGIGLALVKQLTELHGGIVSVESAGSGAGSEFIVRLPLVVPAPAEPAAVQSKQGAQLAIVMVEDNPDVARVMKMALEQAGHQVSLFHDGPSALTAVRALAPDAVVLDIGLPAMDGYELLAKMKQEPRLRNTLFIGISGFKRRTSPAKPGLDFDYYLEKPVEIADVLALLARHPQPAGPLRVLLVEDNAAVAAMTAAVLTREGLVAHTVRTGREALDAAPSFEPQIVLCDMNLPDMYGRDVIRALRSTPAGRKAYAVIVSARSESELRAFTRHGKEMGVDEFVSKPITQEVAKRLARTVTSGTGFSL